MDPTVPGMASQRCQEKPKKPEQDCGAQAAHAAICRNPRSVPATPVRRNCAEAKSVTHENTRTAGSVRSGKREKSGDRRTGVAVEAERRSFFASVAQAPSANRKQR